MLIQDMMNKNKVVIRDFVYLLRNLFLLFFLSVYLFTALPAQDSLQEVRIKALEKMISTEKMIEEKVSAANAEQNLKIEKQNLAIEKFTTYSWSIIAGGMLLGFIGILGGWLVVYNRAKAFAQKLVDKEISRYFKKKKSFFVSLVRSEESEQKLLHESKVLVLRWKNSPIDGRFSDQVLKAFGNGQVDERVVDGLQEFSLDTYDLVFVDNQTGDFDLNKALEYLQAAANKGCAFFYFGTLHLDREAVASQLLAGTANFPSQIYGNMMNLLKIRRFMG